MAALKISQEILNIIYPVGSVYMSTNSTDPSILFGATWTKIERRLLCATVNTPMRTGGSGTHSHGAGSLVACYDPKNSWNNALFRVKNVSNGWTLSGYMSEGRGWNDGGGGAGRGIAVVGDTSSTETYPPYFEVYMWYRTA